MIVHVARSERRARLLARAVGSLVGDGKALPFPAWDSLPYDRVPPSRAVIGRRLATLRLLEDGGSPDRVVLTSVEALSQRIAGEPAAAAACTLATGDALDPEELSTWLRAHGYVLDERVDEPGEAALRGAVVDLFPAGDELPCRLDLDEGRIAAIRRYDPLTQRSIASIDRIVLDAAEEAAMQPAATLLERLPGVRLVLDAGIEPRREAFLELVREAHAARTALQRSEAAAAGREELPPLPPPPERLYLDEAAWDGLLAGVGCLALQPADDTAAVPAFRARPRPSVALAAFVHERLEAGDRVVLAAEDERRERRLVGRLDRAPQALASWQDVARSEVDGLATLRAVLPTGFWAAGLTLVAAADVLALPAGAADAALLEARLGIGSLRPGDHVVHARHGVGRLCGLEAVRAEASNGEHLVIEYAGEQRLLVPVLELDQVWRYGTAEAAVSLDRIDGDDWGERCRRIEGEIAQAANELARLARERQRLAAPALRPQAEPFARLVRRFAYEPTDDQAVAIEATLAELARSTPPMDRLVVGDVGFGKTEVAVRAAAAAALSGRQVALLAPTTLLVRQHLQTFRRRFAGLGVCVEQLSRLGRSGEARAVRAGLADGSVQVVIGTHALASPQLRFKDLALVVIDEEQRFGARHKEALRRLTRGGVHVLTMSATPIPRTLQSALAGIRDVSLIATPPVRRRPVRTFVLPFEPGLVREALERERRRGGRSFVVVPRIADLEPMHEHLRALVPDFDIVTAHGRMKAEALDEAVLAFADGRHDVLLTTSIIEAGLDIPGADTMIVWRADRFGVAQLHQLRGRVGRGRERAVCYLLHDPDTPLAPAAAQRLRTLGTFEDLGAGFLISLHDLDQRGAGDLAGDEQSGHVRLVGTGLYQEMLARAFRRARGQAVEEPFSPELELGLAVRLPEDYVPEPELRLELYARLARLTDPDAVEDLAAEIADRFGPLPDEATLLLEVAGLRAACRCLQVARLQAGEKAVAASFRDPGLADRHAAAPGLRRSGERIVLDRASGSAAERLAAARELLDRLRP